MHETPSSTPQPDNQSGTARRQETEPRPSPAIYVASLADYNNGVLHGAWIDAARDPEDIQADINDILDSSRQADAEEWAIHDFEQFGRWRVDEYQSIEQVSRVARGIAEHGDAFSAWADLHDDESELWDEFPEAYLGHYDSTQDYIDQLADDLGYTDELTKLPDSLQPYVRFHTAALARDMELSGDLHAVDDPRGGVWLFQRTS